MNSNACADYDLNQSSFNFDDIAEVFQNENEFLEGRSNNESSENSLNDLVIQEDLCSDIKNKSNLPIFNGSTINTDTFNLLLALFVSRFNLSFKCADELLKFLEFILPQPNNLTLQFNNIMKLLEISNSYTMDLLCSSCWNPVTSESVCTNSDCDFSEIDSLIQKDCSLELYTFDINKQINEIIRKEHETIIQYRIV